MPKISVHWFRRDLRIEDNTALFHALNSGSPTLLLFIFDTSILDKIENKLDTRVTFIHTQLEYLQAQLRSVNSSILIKHGDPTAVWNDLLNEYSIDKVFFNEDYEPSCIKRDTAVTHLLKSNNVDVNSCKDHLIFHKNEITKSDGTPYTVFTPYYKRWLEKINNDLVKSIPSELHLDNLLKTIPFNITPDLNTIGFKKAQLMHPEISLENKLVNYEKWRDFPAKDATTYLGVHLRFGTISIRSVYNQAKNMNADKWIAGLAWRDFYSMILWHFPETQKNSFKKNYDFIKWRNNPEEFEAWCNGKTGYPLVDAGMRQLNETGFMHNRVRMIVASFLTKHLLIDWRWGEAYFAATLLDYDMANNIGGWQWASGSGNDAAPYFRIFNPTTQLQKFDPDLIYCSKWIKELKTEKYVQPIVEHTFARTRALKTYSEGVGAGAKSSTTS